MGLRLRFLRKRRGLTVIGLSNATGVSHNAISSLERGFSVPKAWTLGPILSFFGDEAAELFPGGVDAYDSIIPPTDFGAWLNNFRLRKGWPLKSVARVVGISAVAVHYYEQGRMKPTPAVIKRFRKGFKLNGELDRFLNGGTKNG
jgi:transcriptional regulator with XRE-family HTH domain